jgi:hypothetical protein
VCGGVGGAKSVWSYVDGDALAAIDASDYFVLEVGRLKVGDVILAVGNSVAGVLVVASNTGTAVDTSNAITLIDSD